MKVEHTEFRLMLVEELEKFYERHKRGPKKKDKNLILFKT